MSETPSDESASGDEQADPAAVRELLNEALLPGEKVPPERLAEAREAQVEELEAHLDKSRDERLLEKVAPENHLGEWDPTTDDALHRFIALREAGFDLDLDVVNDLALWVPLTERVDCRDLGAKIRATPGDYFSGPTHESDADLLNLDTTEDWERLKELTDFERAEFPMAELRALIQEVVDDDA